MKKTGYGVSLVKPKRRKMDWKLFVHDILTFRAHVWWAQFVLIIASLIIISDAYVSHGTLYFALGILALAMSVGSIVDISSHEWRH